MILAEPLVFACMLQPLLLTHAVVLSLCAGRFTLLAPAAYVCGQAIAHGSAVCASVKYMCVTAPLL
jgi:hypothetical protein